MDKPATAPSSRSQVRIASGSVICSECELSGEVVIGPNTIIHPKARILAEAGPVHLGAFNLVEEQAVIVNRTPNTIMKIGDHNVFEVGTHCEAAEIGDNNVFEAKSHIGPNVRITNGCVIGAMCSLTSGETLPDCTIIYGEECRRRTASERPPAQTLQLDFLTKILPNYHVLLKASRSAPGSQKPGS